MKGQDDPRLREILVQATELPPEQRSAFLDSACSGNTELRTEVESLLGHLEQEKSLLREATVPPGALHADLPPGISSLSSAEGPGSRIGRYKLLQLIGEGGFGTVFMAEQEHPVRRRVALKIIKLGMDTKQVIARFEAERQALAMMDHPNIARVLDAGTTETGRPYFVMELVKGIPITEYCDTQNLSARERLKLFVPVCQAVQHAHQKGIIHRDLKPSNVLVTLADGTPVPKIIDFGIAKATNARLTEQTYFTEFRQFIGTPQYMSPEQAEMSAIDIDTRSDIYSLGVLLYELLTGTTPLDAKSLRAAAYDQVRQMIREVEPPRPSTRLSTLGETAGTVAKQRSTEAHKLGQLLRGELDWIVMKALEKDRTRRYETANGLASDIQRHLNNEPVLARPPSRVYAVQKFVSRHRVGAIAGSAVAAALVIGLALATYGLVKARAETAIADKQRKLAVENANKADANAKTAEANAQTAQRNSDEAQIRLAEGLVAQADALSIADRFSEAHSLYIEAYDRLAGLKQPLISSETGLSNLYQRVSFPLMTFSGHSSTVWGIAIFPDGRNVLSAAADKTLKLWDVASGRVIRTFTGDGGVVSSVAISPGGRTALSGGSDKILKLWDLETGTVIRTFAGHTDWVWCVAIAPNGRTALSASFDHTVKLWDLSSGKNLHTFVDAERVWCVAITPNGQTALSGGDDKTLKLWELATGKELRTFTGHEGEVCCVAIAADGRTALSGGGDKMLKLWDLATGKELRTFTGHKSTVMAVAFAPDGRTALSGSEDGILKSWDLGTGRELCTFAGHNGWVSRVTISADGRSAFSASDDKTIKVWDLASANNPKAFAGHTDRVNSVAVSPDGRTALSGGADNLLKLWDVASRREIRTFTGHTRAVRGVAMAPDGRTALSGGEDGTLKLWDLATGEEIRTLTGHTDKVSSVAISPDGRTALSGSDDKTMKLWDLATGKEIQTFTGHSDLVTCVAFAPDRKTALSGSYDNTVKLWDLASGKELRTLAGHTLYVWCVVVSPDGRTAISGGSDDTLKLWDLATGKEIRTFVGHKSDVVSVAIAPDGRIALSGSIDNTIKTWDLATGKELRTFIGHTGWVMSVAIAPDGQAVISGGADKTVRLWNFVLGPQQRTFESRAAVAQGRLIQNPSDVPALLTLGEWFAFRGASQRALDYLIRARDSGGSVAPIVLARCHWNMGQLADARREFQIALEQSRDSSEQNYLRLCISSIDAEPHQRRQNDAVVMVSQLKEQADHELSAGRTRDATKHLAAASVADPQDTQLALRTAVLQAWFDQSADLATTFHRTAEHARGTTNPDDADNVAEIGVLNPSPGKQELQTAMEFARRAVQFGRGHDALPRYHIALSMAQYRAGQYSAADETLRVAPQSPKDDPRLPITSALYRAMSLVRSGKEIEARAFFEDAESKMRPLPDDEQNPMSGATPEDLELWLAYKEAKALLAMGPKASEAK